MATTLRPLMPVKALVPARTPLPLRGPSSSWHARPSPQGKLLADPSGEEEEILESLVTIALDEAGRLVRLLRRSLSTSAPPACTCMGVVRQRALPLFRGRFPQLMVHKAGGKVGATEAVLADCIEAAKVRYGEMAKKLRVLAAEAAAAEAEEGAKRS